MRILLLLGTLALAACAPMQPMQPLPDNLTFEQRLELLKVMQAQRVHQLPIYQNDFVMPQMRQNRLPTMCQSTRSGQTTDTFCY